MQVTLVAVLVDVTQLLAPPLPAARSTPAGVSLPADAQLLATPVRAQESFHVVSGMYDRAEDSVVELFVVDQYVDQLLDSLKSVPPTATLNGVEAVPLTAKPYSAAVSEAVTSHTAEPLSPEATSTVMP
jgi:hypothetical protein